MPPEENTVEKEIQDLIESIEAPRSAEKPPETPPVEAKPPETPPAEKPPEKPPEAPPAEKPPEAPPAEKPPEKPPEKPAETPPAPPPATPPQPPEPVAPQATKPPTAEELEKAWAEREKALMAQIAELSTKAATAPPPPEPPKPGETPPKPEMAMYEFFKTEEEVNKALDTKDGVNELLSRVIHTATEHVMRNIPGVVINVARGQANLVNQVRDFYSENKDLVPHKAFVGYTANQLQAQHPDWNTEKLFEESEKEVRIKLGLKKQAMASPGAGAPPTGPTPPVPPAGGGPAFAAGGMTRKGGGASNITQQQKEILDLIE